MKAGRTEFEVGTAIEVLGIASNDPDDLMGVVGTTGELTHPFGDQPDTVLGVWVREEGSTGFPIPRIGLCKGDTIKIVATGEEVVI